MLFAHYNFAGESNASLIGWLEHVAPMQQAAVGAKAIYCGVK
jgi:hypothetical protein